MTTIGTIFGDFSDELGTDLEAALGTVDDRRILLMRRAWIRPMAARRSTG
jgi:hypothetical protein